MGKCKNESVGGNTNEFDRSIGQNLLAEFLQKNWRWPVLYVVL